jgi:tetratricopeptide (TPR) repeat protein
MAILERKRGVAKRLLGYHDESEMCLNKSIELLQNGAPRELVRSYQERGVFYFKRAGTQEAGSKEWEAYTKAYNSDFAAARSLLDKNLRSMHMEDKILQLFYEGEIAKLVSEDLALNYYQNAAAEAPEFMWDCHSGILPFVYGKMGEILFERRDLYAAESYYEKQLAYFEKFPTDTITLINTYCFLGNVLGQMDDATEAEIYFEEAENLARKLPKGGLEPIQQMNYGLVLMNLGKYEDAKNYLSNAFDSMLEMGLASNGDLGTCQLNIGTSNVIQMRWREAIQSTRNALSFCRSNDSSFDVLRLGAYSQMVMIYANVNLDTAALYLDSTLQNFPSHHEGGPDFSDAAIQIASYLQAAGKVDLVLQMMDNEYRRFVPGYHPKSSFELPDFSNAHSPWHIIQITSIKARSLYMRYLLTKSNKDLLSSLDYYMAAIRLLKEGRLKRSRMESKLQMVQGNRKILEGALQVAANLYHEEQVLWAKDSALTICENGKSMVLMEALLEAKAETNSGVPSSELSRLRKLEDSVARVRALMMSSIGNTAALKDEEFRIGREITLQKDSMRKTYPRYFGQMSKAGQIDLPALQKKLAKDTASILEYFLTDSTLYTFVITAKHFELYSQKLDPQFHQTLDRFCTQVGKGKNDRDTAAVFCSHGHYLYKVLLGNIPLPLTERLIIIPDGKLNYLPFDALIELPCKPDVQFNQLHYLVQSKIISFNYSANFIQLEELPPLKQAARILGVAPEFDSKRGLDRLKYAREGVLALAARFKHTTTPVGCGSHCRYVCQSSPQL